MAIRIMQDIYDEWSRYGILSLWYGSGIFLILFYIRKKLRILSGGARWVELWILLVYAALVVCIALLERESGSRTGVNLVLFSTLAPSVRVYALENIALFVPLGILIPLIWHKLGRTWKVLLIGMAVSLMMEGIQYITKRGYFELDDIVFNALGALVGYVGYKGMVFIKNILKNGKRWNGFKKLV